MRISTYARGSALLIAIVLVAALSIGAAAVIRLTHITLRESGKDAKTEVARQLAEAGIDKAVAMLRVNPAYAGEEPTPLGAGRFTVSVQRDGAAFTISSLGEAVFQEEVKHRAALDARLELGVSGEVRTLTWAKRKSGL